MSPTTKDYLCDCHGVSVYGPPHHLTPAMSPTTQTTKDLGAWMRQASDTWKDLTDAEREFVRAEYVAAGWKICAHAECKPWDCEVSR